MKQNNTIYIRKPGPPESMEGRLLKEVRVHRINTASLRIPARDVFETFLQAIHHDFIKVHLSR